MSELGIDHAWGVPDPAHVAAGGYSLVARYLSNDPGKDLGAAELAGLLAAGRDVIVVWETTADRALSGRAGGLADGQATAARLAALGAPPWVAGYFAVDFDATTLTMPAVVAYADGFRTGLAGRAAGVYGEYDVCAAVQGAGHATYAWQTVAWSGGRRWPGACLFQRAQTVAIDGVSCDVDEVLTPHHCGGWLTQPPTPARQGAPMVVHDPHDNGMYLVLGRDVVVHIPNMTEVGKLQHDGVPYCPDLDPAFASAILAAARA